MTICAHGRRLLFEDQRFRNVVAKVWRSLGIHNAHVQLDSFVVMPNHVHGIIILEDSAPETGASPDKPANPLRAGSLPQLVQMLKSYSTRRINNIRHAAGATVWQRGYWEHIIRNDQSLERIRHYIAENPLNWDRDPENPLATQRRSEDLWDQLLAEGSLILVAD